MTTTGAPVWIDLGVPDIEAAKQFYTAVFGWTYVDAGEQFGHYHQIFAGNARVGGLMQNVDPADNDNVAWTVYFLTPDAEATLAGVSANGGQVLVPAMPVGDMGSMAIAAAPSGAQFGLWQPGTLEGFDSGPAGTAIWFDTPTMDFAADVAFYDAIFGWDTRYMGDDPASGFATIGPYESANVGLFNGTEMFGPDSRSQWRVFFDVADMDAAVAAINASGGRITDGPEDMSDGTVRQVLATAVDPSGAGFLVMQTIKD